MSAAFQNWRKLGRIFIPTGEVPWMRSHASVPFAEHVTGNLFKIYFSSRNENNESAIGHVVVDIDCPDKSIEVSSSPILSKGTLGAFDDSGCMGSCLINHGGIKYLYYIGWNLGKTVPFRNSIGLATSNDGINFKRAFLGPIIERTKDEPYFAASNCVLIEDGLFRIWYLSCTGWEEVNGVPAPRYHIKYAESDDGVTWQRKGVVAINYSNNYECCISVPRVIKENGLYKMWFSSRGSRDCSTYRIRYAESCDGINWKRHDNLVGLDVSKAGWDSEMIEYPFVFDHRGKRFMLYNGNGYGKTGFGLAVLD
jgi:predicted GH43/DUF377 family glycosyl hydrolase